MTKRARKVRKEIRDRVVKSGYARPDEANERLSRKELLKRTGRGIKRDLSEIVEESS